MNILNFAAIAYEIVAAPLHALVFCTLKASHVCIILQFLVKSYWRALKDFPLRHDSAFGKFEYVYDFLEFLFIKA